MCCNCSNRSIFWTLVNILKRKQNKLFEIIISFAGPGSQIGGPELHKSRLPSVLVKMNPVETKEDKVDDTEGEEIIEVWMWEQGL